MEPFQELAPGLGVLHAGDWHGWNRAHPRSVTELELKGYPFFRKCFDDVLGQRAAAKLLRRVQFHCTPKHASWLNMAEIEIGILSRQCLDRRIVSRQLLQSEVDAWQQARNAEQ
jgi:hypothetical protein